MTRPTGRVLTLLELLQSGGTRTVAELADRIGVTGRTVRRYVDQLVDLGVPVEAVRGRYGGYRLGVGYRLPPLIFSDDEALAVLLGLVAGRRSGLTTAAATASETAAAKIRRVLPRHLAERLDTVLESLTFTEPPGEFATPDSGVLLTLADAVGHHRPVSIRYTDRGGRRTDRTLHPYGIVAHSGRWYVTGTDPGIQEARTLRLDRITDARTLPGSFEPPAALDTAERVLSGFATAAYRHEVTLRIHGTPEQIRTRLPASVATITDPAPKNPEGQGEGVGGGQGEGEIEAGGQAEGGGERWLLVEMRVERLDWLPSVIASLDRPFVIERPDELRDLVVAFADRLAGRARRARVRGPERPGRGASDGPARR